MHVLHCKYTHTHTQTQINLHHPLNKVTEVTRHQPYELQVLLTCHHLSALATPGPVWPRLAS